jgi:hypothetical protein
MAIYSFNKDMFPSLLAQDLVPGYNSIGFADLSSVESEVLGGFIGLLGDPIGKELDESNVLLVKADNAGIVTQVYGASIFKGESGLVLKVGNNEFLVSQANGGFEVGALIGEIAFADKPVEAVVKDEAGEERRIDLYPATVNFLFAPEGDEDNAIEYQVRCSGMLPQSRSLLQSRPRFAPTKTSLIIFEVFQLALDQASRQARCRTWE